MINQMIDHQAERTAKRARVDEADAILAANDGNNRLRIRQLDRGAQLESARALAIQQIPVRILYCYDVLTKLLHTF